MENKFSEYNIEWHILVNIAKGDIARVKEIISNCEINWGELIEQAMSHKMFSMVCYEFIIDDELFGYVPPFINQYFRLCYDANVMKTKAIKNETIKIDCELSKRNIPYAATKGVILDKMIYGNTGERFLSDADYMILPQYRNDVAEVLSKLGFCEGTVEWRSNSLRKLSREEHMRYLLTEEKLPEYIKPIEDSIITYVSVGFVCSFTWAKCEYSVDMEKAFQHLSIYDIDDENNKVSGLDISYHFVYIILHLYKHAWVEFLSKWRNDVNLVKFSDVYRYWRKNEELLLNELPGIMKEFNIEKPVLWTLYHTDQIFGSDMIGKLHSESFVENNKLYLNSASDKQGNPRYWRGSMMDRLYSKKREELFLDN